MTSPYGGPDDWTAAPDGRSNASELYLRMVGEIAKQIASLRVGGPIEPVARWIVSHLAHVHGLAPRDRSADAVELGRLAGTLSEAVAQGRMTAEQASTLAAAVERGQKLDRDLKEGKIRLSEAQAVELVLQVQRRTEGRTLTDEETKRLVGQILREVG